MLFTFPSRYWSTIGLSGVFSLAGWSRLVHAGFLVSRVTQDTGLSSLLARTGLSPSAAELSSSLPLRTLSIAPVLQPRARLDAPGLGSYRFARHYSGNHFCFLFLRLLRCFSSAGSLLSQVPLARRVPPFGHPRINGHLRLPAAFRSLSRPSSPLRAKASSVRS